MASEARATNARHHEAAPRTARLRRGGSRGTIRFMAEARTRSQHAILWIGSIGPLGYAPASGTVTVGVIGIPLFWLMHDWSRITYVACTLLVMGTAVRLHAAGDRLLGRSDSRCLVWDEWVGFLVAVSFVPFTWQLAALAFVVERLFDIVKIPPANWIDRHWKGGFGVVADDVVAGLYTCCIVHLTIRMWPALVGLEG